jgi:hypothetical protein
LLTSQWEAYIAHAEAAGESVLAARRRAEHAGICRIAEQAVQEVAIAASVESAPEVAIASAVAPAPEVAITAAVESAPEVAIAAEVASIPMVVSETAVEVAISPVLVPSGESARPARIETPITAANACAHIEPLFTPPATATPIQVRTVKTIEVIQLRSSRGTSVRKQKARRRVIVSKVASPVQPKHYPKDGVA